MADFDFIYKRYVQCYTLQARRVFRYVVALNLKLIVFLATAPPTERFWFEWKIHMIFDKVSTNT